MDTTRWGEGFPGVPQEPVRETPPRVPNEPEDSCADPDYPFEEPEMAPELRQQRSESLYSRSTPFWDRVVERPAEGEEYPRDPEYWNHPEQLTGDVIMRVDSDRPGDVLRRFLGSGVLRYLVAAVVVLVVVAVLFRSVFMTVRSITVVGNTNISTEKIIELSQLKLGMSTFDIDEKLVMERIGRERYLRCTLVDVSYDTVVLHVRQREPVACIIQNGRRITLDNRGWVLEISDDIHGPTAGLINVVGLDVQHCYLGQEVDLRDPARLAVYNRILVELKALGGLSLMTELDMTTMDSITLKTADGFTIMLGNEARIHEKIRAMLIVRESVLENRYYGDTMGGVIVVMHPETPAYRRADSQ